MKRCSLLSNYKTKHFHPYSYVFNALIYISQIYISHFYLFRIFITCWGEGGGGGGGGGGEVRLVWRLV